VAISRHVWGRISNLFGIICARLYNEPNFEKKQVFFNNMLTRKRRIEIDDKYYPDV
jgi:hypothetical protein